MTSGHNFLPQMGLTGWCKVQCSDCLLSIWTPDSLWEMSGLPQPMKRHYALGDKKWVEFDNEDELPDCVVVRIMEK
jgi:hypothetical protein